MLTGIVFSPLLEYEALPFPVSVEIILAVD